MQCKFLLPAIFLVATAAVPARAQYPVAAPKPAATIAKKDSAATKTAAKPLLASNVPPAVTEIIDGKKKFNHVPLAGEKSYFGEKNEYVNDFVRKYLEQHNRTLEVVQSNSSTPFTVIDDILEQKNMPKELKYLAVIESALRNNAVSHAGAVGPWQLMATTAKMMGLNVSRKKDERTDWYKSTTAATKYLELLYGQLNDWLLVIAAYNSGPTPVQKAIERTGSRNFWDIKEYLPRETQGHVLAFIATASIFENFSKFINLGSIPVDLKFGKDEEILAAPTPVVAAPAGTPAAAAAGNTAAAPRVGPPPGVAPVAIVAVPGKAPAAPATGTTATTPAAAAPAASAPAVTTTVVKKPAYSDEELKNMTIVRITSPISLELLATEISFDKRTLARWNSDYDGFIYKNYPTPYYNLRIPKDRLDVFLSKKEAMTKRSVTIFAQVTK